MSKYKVGDKFIIEIDRIRKRENAESDIYHVKNLNDEFTRDFFRSLEKLDKTYDDGLGEAWELMNRIAAMTWDTRKRIFGYECQSIEDILKVFTPHQAIEKLEAYEIVNGIRRGDEVELKAMPGLIGTVTHERDDWCCVVFDNGGVGEHHKSDFIKTGNNHINELNALLGKTGE